MFSPVFLTNNYVTIAHSRLLYAIDQRAKIQLNKKTTAAADNILVQNLPVINQNAPTKGRIWKLLVLCGRKIKNVISLISQFFKSIFGIHQANPNLPIIPAVPPVQLPYEGDEYDTWNKQLSDYLLPLERFITLTKTNEFVETISTAEEFLNWIKIFYSYRCLDSFLTSIANKPEAVLSKIESIEKENRPSSSWTLQSQKAPSALLDNSELLQLNELKLKVQECIRLRNASVQIRDLLGERHKIGGTTYVTFFETKLNETFRAFNNILESTYQSLKMLPLFKRETSKVYLDFMILMKFFLNHETSYFYARFHKPDVGELCRSTNLNGKVVTYEDIKSLIPIPTHAINQYDAWNKQLSDYLLPLERFISLTEKEEFVKTISTPKEFLSWIKIFFSYGCLDFFLASIADKPEAVLSKIESLEKENQPNSSLTLQPQKANPSASLNDMDLLQLNGLKLKIQECIRLRNASVEIRDLLGKRHEIDGSTYVTFFETKVNETSHAFKNILEHTYNVLKMLPISKRETSQVYLDFVTMMNFFLNQSTSYFYKRFHKSHVDELCRSTSLNSKVITHEDIESLIPIPIHTSDKYDAWNKQLSDYLLPRQYFISLSKTDRFVDAISIPEKFLNWIQIFEPDHSINHLLDIIAQNPEILIRKIELQEEEGRTVANTEAQSQETDQYNASLSRLKDLKPKIEECIRLRNASLEVRELLYNHYTEYNFKKYPQLFCDKLKETSRAFYNIMERTASSLEAMSASERETSPVYLDFMWMWNFFKEINNKHWYDLFVSELALSPTSSRHSEIITFDTIANLIPNPAFADNRYVSTQDPHLTQKIGNSIRRFFGSAYGHNNDQQQQLAATVRVEGEQGLNNIGQTCWMNSALQAIRKSPTLMAKIAAPLIRQLNENETAFSQRKSIHLALQQVFEKLEGSEDPHTSLLNLQEVMLSIKNLDVVPSDLSNIAKKRDQKDVALAFECFLNVIDYSIGCVNKNFRNGKAESDTPEPSLRHLIPSIYPKTSFLDLVEKEACHEPDVKEGKLRQERRFTELPTVMVISLKRFKADNAQLLRNHSQQKLPNSTYETKGSYERFYGTVQADLIQKDMTLISLEPDEILDLSKSFLTADLNENLRKKAKYRLVSFVTHAGASLNTGHFTACVKTKTNSWCHISDTNITIPSPKELNTYVQAGCAFVWEQCP